MVRFAFTEIILRLLIKSLIFGMSLTYFHTVMAPLKFLKWIHVNDFLSQNNLINVATQFDELQKSSLSVLYVFSRKSRKEVTFPRLPTQ